jgi:hypothetical protein
LPLEFVAYVQKGAIAKKHSRFWIFKQLIPGNNSIILDDVLTLHFDLTVFKPVVGACLLLSSAISILEYPFEQLE